MLVGVFLDLFSDDTSPAVLLGVAGDTWTVDRLLDVFPQPPLDIGDPDIPDTDFSHVDNGIYWHREAFHCPWDIEHWSICLKEVHEDGTAIDLCEDDVTQTFDGDEYWRNGYYKLYFKVARQPAGWMP